jgi:hypothetical protein
MPLKVVALAFAILLVLAATLVRADEPVALRLSRAETEALWQARIRSFLDRGVVPIVDLESSLRREDGERYRDELLSGMDRLGIALIAFDGFPARRDSKSGDGYRWGYYIHEIVNADPDRFVLAINGGTNPNWGQQKGGRPTDFIDQVESEVRSGAYPIMGEFDFRHYLSEEQCKKGRADRDVDIALDSPNGHRLFKLSAETGIAFAIHNEPEDDALDGLERMLAAYPNAKVIVAHFGQLRNPEKQTRFTPEYVRRLFQTHPHLYFDLSTGAPGRVYRCAGGRHDTVIWDEEGGRQVDRLAPAYAAILTEFADRFVAGTDYGGGRPPLPSFLNERVKNLRLILRDLSPEAQHAIAYRNAWRLLTGRSWEVAAAQ